MTFTDVDNARVMAYAGRWSTTSLNPQVARGK